MGKARARDKTAQAGVTLDAGALIAIERGDRRMIALLRDLAGTQRGCRVPAGVVAQVWRNGPRQATLARFLNADEVHIECLDGPLARATGELCGVSGTSDVIDASVVIAARAHGDVIVTSDVEDLRKLDPSARLARI